MPHQEMRMCSITYRTAGRAIKGKVLPNESSRDAITNAATLVWITTPPFKGTFKPLHIKKHT